MNQHEMVSLRCDGQYSNAVDLRQKSKAWLATAGAQRAIVRAMTSFSENLADLPAQGRIMALDVGDVRTGIAISDALQILASPHSVLTASADAALADAIAALATTEEAAAMVVGLPLNKDGTRGPQAEKVLAFSALLAERSAIPVILSDERYTTAAAERSLIGAGMRRDKRKKVVDKVAAAGILRDALDRAAGAKARAARDQQ